ncbi:aminomethyl-transferring glycine dehydrogenase subunit GcvPA [Rhodomicrobium sp. Az07]|uniref:aminomethyl-transferring glycine dehydrogenase subunit GcvPA n=1 Tax=Rhodomicrobium sp. Az07 TaxID=2839034 RepID=UPI001BEB400D|nr:aminomethyl-transferring glycine dehydrogenase subunit GcvPA [Rhodomicrobium sp. Az07]MBT3071573.1 aminomethyl-transferring glycine dehydrogenase subunit GcvPA [Rhodomicrobium sp. Az07]
MRYLPHTDADRRTMLDAIGVADIDALFAAVPEGSLRDELPDLPRAQSEIAVERALSRLAARNVPASSVPFFAGAGAYKHHVPATVDHIIQRSEFMTAYTPYQPEIAQGTLHYLFEFQTQVAALTGMEVANASMYDGSTAASEAVLMAHRVTRRGKAVVAGGVHPHYRAVIETVSRLGGFEVDARAVDPATSFDADADNGTSCIVVQMPDAFGRVADLSALADKAHEAGALLVVVVTEAVSFGALKSPGAMGADIVVAEGQSIGNGLNFGGPYLGLFATRKKFVRQMPGRLCGETVDHDGRRGFVLTLSTREQHIRREKATSNICTNSGLCALAFTAHLTLLGEAGLRKLARVNHASAVALAKALERVEGVDVITPAFFNEFTIRTPKPGAAVIDALADRGVIGGVPASRLWPDEPTLAHTIVVAATETTTPDDIAAFRAALEEVLHG